ncbi:MAG: GNAT family N-acetyltransferase [Paracoccaceae bacterium]
MAQTHAAAFQRERPWRAEEFASLLSQPTVFACGDARAFALIRVVADEAELLTIATAPQHQRQGQARRIMSDWHAKAAQRGAIRAILEVAEDNIEARALYASCGYSECARRPEYYATAGGSYVDAILMDRQLP